MIPEKVKIFFNEVNLKLLLGIVTIITLLILGETGCLGDHGISETGKHMDASIGSEGIDTDGHGHVLHVDPNQTGEGGYPHTLGQLEELRQQMLANPDDPPHLTMYDANGEPHHPELTPQIYNALRRQHILKI